MLFTVSVKRYEECCSFIVKRYGECSNTLPILFTSIKFQTKEDDNIVVFFTFSCSNRFRFVVIISVLHLENSVLGFC